MYRPSRRPRSGKSWNSRIAAYASPPPGRNAFDDVVQSRRAEPAPARVDRKPPGCPDDWNIDSIAVAETEPRLPVARDDPLRSGSPQQVAVEAEVVPVLMIWRRDESNRPHALDRIHAAVGAYEQLIRLRLDSAQRPPRREDERAVADVANGRAESQVVLLARRTPGAKHA
jgi:hypothetical protein